MLLSVAAGVGADTIAVTEFLTNPAGVEATEWVELFNYGASDVDLTGWTIDDEIGGSAVLPGVILPSGAYLVLTGDAAQFLGIWFGGGPNSSVFELSSGFALNNTTDQLILRNAQSDIVWNLAYINDETTGRAAFLTGNDFSITDYGTAAAPGVNRSGDDNGLAGFLGYQQNDVTADPFAFTSVAGDLGSPLAGHYTFMPAPGALVVLLAGGVASTRGGRRRRARLTASSGAPTGPASRASPRATGPGPRAA